MRTRPDTRTHADAHGITAGGLCEQCPHRGSPLLAHKAAVAVHHP